MSCCVHCWLKLVSIQGRTQHIFTFRISVWSTFLDFSIFTIKKSTQLNETKSEYTYSVVIYELLLICLKYVLIVGLLEIEFHWKAMTMANKISSVFCLFFLFFQMMPLNYESICMAWQMHFDRDFLNVYQYLFNVT